MNRRVVIAYIVGPLLIAGMFVLLAAFSGFGAEVWTSVSVCPARDGISQADYEVEIGGKGAGFSGELVLRF